MRRNNRFALLADRISSPLRNDRFTQDLGGTGRRQGFRGGRLGICGVPSLPTGSDPFFFLFQTVKNMKSSYFLILLCFPCLMNAAEFFSDFKNTHDRVWLGEDYWANPMEDWLVREGRTFRRNGGTGMFTCLPMDSIPIPCLLRLFFQSVWEWRKKKKEVRLDFWSVIDLKAVIPVPACSWEREWRSV